MKNLNVLFFCLSVATVFACNPQESRADWTETISGGSLDIANGGNPGTWSSGEWAFLDDSGNFPPSDTELDLSNNTIDFIGSHNEATSDVDIFAAGLVNEIFSDVRVTATVSQFSNTTVDFGFEPGNNDVFVLARSNFATSYLLSLDFKDGDVDLVYVSGPGAAGVNVLTHIEDPFWFDAAETFTLELSVFGSDLFGRIFDDNGMLVETLSATDSNLTAGFSGVGAQLNNDNNLSNADRTLTSTRFDDISSVTLGSADFDNDGDVDGSDFLTWQTGFGSGTELNQGDVNGDGNVTDIDFAAWLSQFGSGAGAGSIISSGNGVPEPSSMVILFSLLAGICLLFNRKK